MNFFRTVGGGEEASGRADGRSARIAGAGGGNWRSACGARQEPRLCTNTKRRDRPEEKERRKREREGREREEEEDVFFHSRLFGVCRSSSPVFLSSSSSSSVSLSREGDPSGLDFPLLRKEVRHGRRTSRTLLFGRGVRTPDRRTEAHTQRLFCLCVR